MNYNAESCMNGSHSEDGKKDDVSSSDHQETLHHGLNSEIDTTIRAMKYHNRCLHPHHWHSFRPVHFMFSLIGRPNCIFCEEKVTGVIVPSFYATSQVVHCVACRAYAHRGCSASRTDLWDRRKCSVNATYVMSSSEIGQLEQQQALEVLQQQHNQYLASVVPQVLERNDRCDNQGSLQLQEIQNRNQKQHAIFFDHSGLQVTAVAGTTSHASFVNVNDVLQENIISNFLKDSPRAMENAEMQETTNERLSDVSDFLLTGDNVVTGSSVGSGEDSTRCSNGMAQIVSSVDDDVRQPNDSDLITPVGDITSKKINAAAVAGGIAGGAIGLAFAGPAGAYAGFAAASYIVEGTVALGVVVAGIAYGSKYGPQIEEHVRNRNFLEILPRRVLTMGEHGSSRKVLMVRPHIHIDLYWENKIMVDARRTAPAGKSKSSLIRSTLSLLRYRDNIDCDADIVQSAENELSCNDKVLLLVNRILNDSKSFPGHVYRFLVESYESRCKTPQAILESGATRADTVSPRARRDDAHAVIIHVTATLLETRKEFDSPFITELVATAVEGLILNRLYNLIMEEIREETTVLDGTLQEKALLLAEDFHSTRKSNDFSTNEAKALVLERHMQYTFSVSQDALAVLDILSSCHTAFDKLQFCVKFLKYISGQHCLATKKNSCDLSADSLLKLVCQHILIHVLCCCQRQEMCDINGQIGFLEEFARDEHLLLGREGYSLVTLQASLHFLNESALADLKAELFEDIVFEDISCDKESSR